MVSIFEVLDIKQQEIYTKIPCIITINKEEFKDFIVEYETKLQIPGIVEIYFPDLDDYTQIITNYNSIGVIKPIDFHEKADVIVLTYEEGSKIIEQDYVDTSVNLALISKMLNGKLTYIKTPEHMVNIISDVIPNADLVHIEIMMSNIFRNENGLPGRYGGTYANTHQVGLLKSAKTDSWLSSIAFQNINEAIENGLISEKDAKMNPIEKVLNEEFNTL